MTSNENFDPPARAALWFESALLDTGWARSVRVGVVGGRIGEVACDVAPQPGDEIGAVAVAGLAEQIYSLYF